MIKILVVEDNAAISDIICTSLTHTNYEYTPVYDGKTAADFIEENEYDLILLDIMLPEVDGYELMKYIEPLCIPVIFITAKGSLSDKVKGLQMGADDYIVKPFEVEELLARIETVLRRVGKGKKLLEIEDVIINIVSRSIKKSNEPISLTTKEFDLLVVLAQNKNVVLYKERLYEKVWGEEWDGNTRTLDLHIQRLRNKLSWSDKIQTVYGLGYKLVVDK
ncbi:MAG: response regulator transcription factor [Oscillospiraceae bacterium]